MPDEWLAHLGEPAAKPAETPPDPEPADQADKDAFKSAFGVDLQDAKKGAPMPDELNPTEPLYAEYEVVKDSEKAKRLQQNAYSNVLVSIGAICVLTGIILFLQLGAIQKLIVGLIAIGAFIAVNLAAPRRTHAWLSDNMLPVFCSIACLSVAGWHEWVWFTQPP